LCRLFRTFRTGAASRTPLSPHALPVAAALVAPPQAAQWAHPKGAAALAAAAAAAVVTVTTTPCPAAAPFQTPPLQPPPPPPALFKGRPPLARPGLPRTRSCTMSCTGRSSPTGSAAHLQPWRAPSWSGARGAPRTWAASAAAATAAKTLPRPAQQHCRCSRRSRRHHCRRGRSSRWSSRTTALERA
jgi:hypothetical protein